MITETEVGTMRRNGGLYRQIEQWAAKPLPEQTRALGYLHSLLFGGYVKDEDVQKYLKQAGSFGLAARTLLWVASRNLGGRDGMAVAFESLAARSAANFAEIRKRIRAEIAQYRSRVEEVRALLPYQPALASMVTDLEEKISEAECRLQQTTK